MSKGFDEQVLLPDHQKLLDESAISSEVAAARGYRSVTTKAELKRCGFSDTQCLVPGLLIPIHGVDGGIVNYQLRPDKPRIKDGKPLKYEFPTGSKMVLDVPPAAKADLGNPAVPLFVTEGARKADAAVSIGLCCVALLGVWNWRGRNEHDGKTALADWERVALNNRDVYVVFDSDAMLKREVYGALARIGGFLESRKAGVRYIYLRSAPSGAKVGLDDYLASLPGATVDTLLACASLTLRDYPVADQEHDSDYFTTPEGTFWRKPAEGGSVAQRLCNFSARIVEEITSDDGANCQKEFAIEGTRAGDVPLPRLRVRASQFSMMNWTTDWGARAVVTAGIGAKDRLREAIQCLSPDIRDRQVFRHPGWRHLPDHGWCYLHGSGAITENGFVADVDVELQGDAASRIILPEPPIGESLAKAVHASLDLLDVAPIVITATLLGAVYRSLLSEMQPADSGLHLVGPTGTYKSELSALAMQHFGAGFDRLHLPAQWFSTDNALERACFDFKDAVIVIDDFAPTGTQNDIGRFHSRADRIFRAIGNRGTRSRMNADGTNRNGLPPRGFVISSGEDVPRGQSVRARSTILEVAPGDVNLERLTIAQQRGRDGVYASLTSGFVSWLAGRFDEIRAQCPSLLTDFRSRAHRSRAHARTPDAIANLALGWRIFLQLATETGALSSNEASATFDRVWSALGDAGERQASHQVSEEPARRFVELLASALGSEMAHVASVNGGAPTDAERWGWSGITVGTGLNERNDWRPNGPKVGWVDGDNLYIDPDAALAPVQRLAQAGGTSITVGPKTLAKRLHEGGFLVTTNEAGKEVRIRHTVEGVRRPVLHFATDTLMLEESHQSRQSRPESDISSPNRGDAEDSSRILWPDFSRASEKSRHEIPPIDPDFDDNGGIGGIGGIFPRIDPDDERWANGEMMTV